MTSPSSAAGPTPSPSPPRRRRRSRAPLTALIGGLGALLLALSPLRTGSRPEAAPPALELLPNGRFEEPSGWGAAGAGFEPAPGAGREGSGAIVCASREPRLTTGAFQTLRLDRKRRLPLRVSGWSRAEQVEGAPDDDYSLYATLEYQDGSRLEMVSARFDCGSHGWQRRELLLPVTQPVKSLVLHCLFRNHRGKVWFDDVSVEETRAPEGSMLLEGFPLDPAPSRSRPGSTPRLLETRDGLRLSLLGDRVLSTTVQGRETRASGPSGFLLRDAARGGAWRPVEESTARDLSLVLESRWQAARDHLSVEGELRDLSGTDRAVSLAFAVPVDVLGGSWAEDLRRSRAIEPEGEYVNAVPVSCGSTGTLSRYPLAAVFHRRIGLALAADPELPALHRIGYHAGTGQLFISYDFGILPDGVFLPRKARFRFVLYRVDPAEGFRGALQSLYSIFPESFARRCLEAGTWLPFTPPGEIPQWEDFGFAFRETAPGEAPGGPSPLRRFRYTEPLGVWMPLPPQVPRSTEELLSRWASAGAALRATAMKNEAGLPQFSFRREPWCDGALFSVNPNPRLPGREGPADSAEGPDGEFIDSAEGYAMAELDFDRVHLRHATLPPAFTTDTRVPVLFKGQLIHEYAKTRAKELHAQGRFTFGNGTPHRFSFLAPCFDILGTEVDWFPGGIFSPAGDAELGFRRAMAYQKPYCLLLNTRLPLLTPEGLERYFQRCLFYGMFPGLFSHDAQNDSYWSDPERFERDRPLFRKYVPLIRRTAVAGWQPVTGARCDNPEIQLERFGPDAAGVLYLTVLNGSGTDQEGGVTLEPLRQRREIPSEARELITETAEPVRDRRFRVAIPAGATRLFELREPLRK